jgi:hypothetical protein
LRNDEFATPKAPNKSVAGIRNIVQADIKVSFMHPRQSTNRQPNAELAAICIPLKGTALRPGWLPPHDALVDQALDGILLIGGGWQLASARRPLATCSLR